jgi:hypothetical protein
MDFFKPLLDPDDGFISETAVTAHGGFGSETEKINGFTLNGHPSTDTSARSGATAFNSRGRLSKPTALFWCQDAYRELSRLPLRQLS